MSLPSLPRPNRQRIRADGRPGPGQRRDRRRREGTRGVQAVLLQLGARQAEGQSQAGPEHAQEEVVVEVERGQRSTLNDDWGRSVDD